MLGLGHVLVLLSFADFSDSRPWMFANRHGLPLHFAAAGLAALAVHRMRGWWRVLLILAMSVVLVENGRRPVRLLQNTPGSTTRPEVALALDYLRAHPLPADAVVLSQDCDILALELRGRGVHLRGHLPGAPESDAFLQRLVGREITHVLLTWHDNPHLRKRNSWMDSLERSLAPRCEAVADLARRDGVARALLLRLPP